MIIVTSRRIALENLQATAVDGLRVPFDFRQRAIPTRLIGCRDELTLRPVNRLFVLRLSSPQPRQRSHARFRRDGPSHNARPRSRTAPFQEDVKTVLAEQLKKLGETGRLIVVGYGGLLSH